MIVPKLHPAQAPKYAMPVSSYVGNTQQLTHQGPPTLEGLGTQAATAFIPGSVGAGIVGSLVDKAGTVIKPKLNQALPGLGEVLEVIADMAAWIVEQANWVVKSSAEGVITYLPEAQANAVLKAMDDNKAVVFTDALKDAMVAVAYRMKPTGSPATDLKQGRDTILGWLWEKVLSATGADLSVTNRLSFFIYQKALAAGAKPYEAAAAAGYAQMVGTRMPSIVPQKGTNKDVFGVPIKLPGAVDGNKRVSSVPAGTIDTYLAMVGPNPKREEAWLEQAFKVKSGGLLGNSTAAAAGKPPGTDKEGLPVLPLVAGGAVLLLILSGRKKSS
jgi:hypothetical protein